MKKALIVVDLQNDFAEKGALPVPGASKIIPRVNKLIQEFHKKGLLIVATKDYHPTKHISFAKTHNKKIGETIKTIYGLQKLWPVHCVQGTHGAEFMPGLLSKHIKKTFLKGIKPSVDAYSPFFDESKVSTTTIHEYLQAKGVTDLFVVGVALDFCVAKTITDALNLGYKVCVDLSATKSISPTNNLTAMFNYWKRKGVIILQKMPKKNNFKNFKKKQNLTQKNIFLQKYALQEKRILNYFNQKYVIHIWELIPLIGAISYLIRSLFLYTKLPKSILKNKIKKVFLRQILINLVFVGILMILISSVFLLKVFALAIIETEKELKGK